MYGMNAGAIFFQRCEIRGLSVVVDYKPRRLDVAALRAGNLAEVLNVTAWSGVAVELPHVRLTGVPGWEALGAALAQRYLADVASSQVCATLGRHSKLVRAAFRAPKACRRF